LNTTCWLEELGKGWELGITRIAISRKRHNISTFEGFLGSIIQTLKTTKKHKKRNKNKKNPAFSFKKSWFSTPGFYKLNC